MIMPFPPTSLLRWLPSGLITYRLALALLLPFLGLWHGPGVLLAVLVVTGFLSDLFDGIIARRLGVSTPRLRRYDSMVDVMFWLSVLATAWIVYPDVVIAYAPALAGLIALEILCQTVSLIRFRRTTSTHAYLCKLWAVMLCVACAALLGFGYAGLLMDATLVVGFLAYADVLLILFLASKAPVDTPSCIHVWLAERRPGA
jgi:CDP-diacylglycerol--glycerol-3-phosphate 3-phosphatidyltransferase